MESKKTKDGKENDVTFKMLTLTLVSLVTIPPSLTVCRREIARKNALSDHSWKRSAPIWIGWFEYEPLNGGPAHANELLLEFVIDIAINNIE